MRYCVVLRDEDFWECDLRCWWYFCWNVKSFWFTLDVKSVSKLF